MLIQCFQCERCPLIQVQIEVQHNELLSNIRSVATLFSVPSIHVKQVVTWHPLERFSDGEVFVVFGRNATSLLNEWISLAESHVMWSSDLTL